MTSKHPRKEVLNQLHGKSIRVATPWDIGIAARVYQLSTSPLELAVCPAARVNVEAQGDLYKNVHDSGFHLDSSDLYFGPIDVIRRDVKPSILHELAAASKNGKYDSLSRNTREFLQTLFAYDSAKLGLVETWNSSQIGLDVPITEDSEILGEITSEQRKSEWQERAWCRHDLFRLVYSYSNEIQSCPEVKQAIDRFVDPSLPLAWPDYRFLLSMEKRLEQQGLHHDRAYSAASSLLSRKDPPTTPLIWVDVRNKDFSSGGVPKFVD